MRTIAKRAASALFGAPLSTAPTGWNGQNWDALPVQEKAVQWAAYYADKVKVKEVGNNGGYWVKYFLSRVGLGAGYAWCAAFVSELLYRAGWFRFKSARVLDWESWAENRSLIVYTPERGELAFVVKGEGKKQLRHIEIVIGTAGHPTPLSALGSVPRGYVLTIGGNTSPGSQGSQSDGDGVYRRLRPIDFFSGYIKWWKA